MIRPPTPDDRARIRRRYAIRLHVKLVPAASRSCVDGWLGDTLKVRVTAPPERGKANAALEATLAEALGIARDATRVVGGRTSPRKIVEIQGLSEREVWRRLGKQPV